MKSGRSYHVWALGRRPVFADTLTHNVKVDGGDSLFLTAAHQWSVCVSRAICFLTPKAAEIYLRRLPWKLRERLSVFQCSGEM